MRLWSIHPQYLDRAGLTALWRESLLAQKVLQGETRGYRHHPQLIRFRSTVNPLAAIGCYLSGINHEAECRGYNFDYRKILITVHSDTIAVTEGQIAYEFSWLLAKLKIRQPDQYRTLLPIQTPLPHPLFHIVPGGIAPWEKTNRT